MQPTIHCKYDKLIKAKDLIKQAHPKNSNKHPKDQIERLKKILEYQGFRYPVKVSNLSQFITTGHGRTMAGLEENWDIPVVYQDYEDEAQEFADLTADNAIASWAELDLAKINVDFLEHGPDLDIELLGLKDFEIEPADKYKDEIEDEAPAPPKKAISKPGDLYELGEHRLLCGDSADKDTVDRLMDGAKADMVFTDPPYGINESAEKRKTRETNSLAKSNSHLKEFKDDSIDYAVKAFNLCTDVPVQYWFGANYYCHHLPQTNNWLVWDKRLDDKQINNNSDAELAWVKSKTSSVRVFRHLWKGLIKGSEHGQKRVHPTQKPIALPEWCINKHKPNSVLDLFGGSGSTLIACEKTKRKCYMMEIDPHYTDVIVSRWVKYTGTKEIKRNGEPMTWDVGGDE